MALNFKLFERGCNKYLVKMEWQILILLVAIFGTAWVVNYLHRQDAETSEKVFWSQRKQPLFYEQPDATKAAQVQTVEQYQNAISKLKAHGNKWLTEADVFLWIWGADDENTETDFARWQVLNLDRRRGCVEAFWAMKAQLAARAKEKEALANSMAGKDNDDWQTNQTKI